MVGSGVAGSNEVGGTSPESDKNNMRIPIKPKTGRSSAKRALSKPRFAINENDHAPTVDTRRRSRSLGGRAKGPPLTRMTILPLQTPDEEADHLEDELEFLVDVQMTEQELATQNPQGMWRAELGNAVA